VVYDSLKDNGNDPYEHTCNIWDVVKISDSQVVYLCAVCKRKVAISDKELFGLDIIALIDLGKEEKKVYPDEDQRKIKDETLEEWR
jgi:hypothetical protein